MYSSRLSDFLPSLKSESIIVSDFKTTSES